ncbi:MAG TPA: DUF2127 domain-containing protein [Streptosporangiaceae bacterium]|jgi:uncharacterized membrane protein (DUF2068 family)|nr:DUF2127 domain-containing protein [Streptosporangiaceae bacterium]
MDWNLYRCGRMGHITYAPDEPALKNYMRAAAAGGELWRCLRCGTFVKQEPDGTGPAIEAPVVKRGKEIRSELILRFFAIERFIRFLLFGGVAYAIWQFGHSKQTIQKAFNSDLPIIRSTFNQLGFNIDHSKLLLEFRKALHFSQSTLTLIAVGVALFAIVELVEGVGLWLSKRWGEYFAMVVTSLGLPYEIWDIHLKVTWTKLLLFGINLALVAYLVLTKRLFGARGGAKAFEESLRSASIFDEAAHEAKAAGDELAEQEANAAAEAEAEAEISAT